MDTRLSAQAVAAGQMPDVCARHGERAVRLLPMRLGSPTPGWAYLLLPLGLLPFVIVNLIVGRSVTARAWPLCAACIRRRRRALVTGLGMFAAGLAAMIAGLALQSSVHGLGVVGVLVMFALMVGTLIPISRATPRALTNARVTRDGCWVAVADADPRFHQAAGASPAMPSAGV